MAESTGPELNIVVLEERTRDGWAGAAEITCPHCGQKHVVTVTTSLGGRGVGFWHSPQLKATRRAI